MTEDYPEEPAEEEPVVVGDEAETARVGTESTGGDWAATESTGTESGYESGSEPKRD